MNKTKTIRFNIYNTRRNLPPTTGRKRTESNYLGAFTRYLATMVFDTGYCGKNFALANYGVADLIWALHQPQKQTENGYILYAFETKMDNWRRAFQQAYKYSYYSDASFVVVPPSTGAIAKRYLYLFKAANIGLWIYNSKENLLYKEFTSPKIGARNCEIKDRALNKLASVIG